MKPITILCGLIFLFFGCSEEEKLAVKVLNETTNGAFIRTISFENSVFVVDDPSVTFKVLLEEQDEANGELLERIELFVQFLDRTPGNGDHTTEEKSLKALTPADFFEGPFGLPRYVLELSLPELVEATGINPEIPKVQDQFEVRLAVYLKDGRSFSVGQGSNCIVAYDTFFSSPYSYTINIIDPIPEDLFTGEYRYYAVKNGPFGPTFGESHLVTIRAGASPNVREIRFQDLTGGLTADQVRVHRFTIVGNSAVFRKNQLKLLERNCGKDGQPIMLIPDSEPGNANLLDDAVFELRFQELSNGGTPFPAIIGFTKQ